MIAEFVTQAERCRRHGLLPVRGVPDGFPAALCRIESFGNGLFQPSEERDHPLAVSVLVWLIAPRRPVVTDDGVMVIPGDVGHPGTPLDLAAIDRATDRVYVRRGDAIALGQHAMELPLNNDRLDVVMSPSTWVENGGSGVCPIDRPAFARWCLARPWLHLVTDENDGNQLDHLLHEHRCPVPRIFISSSRGRAAA